jgi:hypothetical protein
MLRDTAAFGLASELLVAAHLASKGHDIHLAIASQSRADLIYVKDGKAVRVQVKSAQWSRFGEGQFAYERCPLLAKSHPQGYTTDEVDELWVVGTHLWCFPIEKLIGKRHIALGSNNPTPRSRYKCNGYIAGDFIIVRGTYDHPFRDRHSYSELSPGTTPADSHTDPLAI